MKVLPEKFNRSVNNALTGWMFSKKPLISNITYHVHFILMNSDGFIDVHFNCLSEKYVNRHILPNPDAYIDMFLEELQPTLMGVQHHKFVIIFSGYKINTTRYIYLGY